MGLSYIDLTIVLQIYSEQILHIQPPPNDIHSLITSITTNTSHHSLLEEVKLKLQSLKRGLNSSFKTTYDAIKKKLDIQQTMSWQNFLDDLVHDSMLLKQLFDPAPEYFSGTTSPRKITNSLKAISAMGAVSYTHLTLPTICSV